jgi:hypothetical protein
MKQTAIDWLIEQWPILESQLPTRIIEQAKEIEKQKIIDAFDEGNPNGFILKNGEQYYNETFNK